MRPQRDCDASGIRNDRYNVRNDSGGRNESPLDAPRRITQQPPHREQQERSDQEIDSRTRTCDQETLIAAHITCAGFELKRGAAHELNGHSRGSEYPPQLIGGCRGVVVLECENADQHHGPLSDPAPVKISLLHTSRRRRRRNIISIAIAMDAVISHASSGSLPIARSLTPSGSGSG